jgi:hypothetical protein
MGLFDRSAAESFNGTQAVIIDCKDKHFDHELMFAPEVAAGNSGAGLSYKKGPILQAMERGQPVVLRNLDLAKAGTANTLHSLLQLGTGEVSQADFFSPTGEKFSYDRSNVGKFEVGATVTNADKLPPSSRYRLERHMSLEPSAPKA